MGPLRRGWRSDFAMKRPGRGFGNGEGSGNSRAGCWRSLEMWRLEIWRGFVLYDLGKIQIARCCD